MYYWVNLFDYARVRNISTNRPEWRNAEDEDQDGGEEWPTTHTRETYKYADQQSDEGIAKIHDVPPSGSLLIWTVEVPM